MRRFGLLAASAVVLAMLATSMSDLAEKAGLAWGRPVESAADFQLDSDYPQGVRGTRSGDLEAASANVIRTAQGSSAPDGTAFSAGAPSPQ